MVSQGTGTTHGSDDPRRGMPAGKSGEMTEQVKETAGQVGEQVKEQAGKVTEQARQQATTRASEQKDRAAQGLSSFADALHQVGSQMRNENPTVANLANTAASRIEQFAGTIESRDVNELITEVQDLARRQPALFIGGAFLAGVFAARFLKSSNGESGHDYRSQRGYGYTGGYGQRYDTSGYGSQHGSTPYGSQYGRPMTDGPSYGSPSYGSTGSTTGVTSGTTGGQDTPGAVRRGTGDTDASGLGIGTTGTTTNPPGDAGSRSDRQTGATGRDRGRTSGTDRSTRPS